ncbi:10024_t:CDS:2 [Acaulospora colombiana]|uniref:10024_t:CDS:1 n=1 Tax=Acaulospora colombiana TaxID=27376 RepID=A0ACA9LCA5_9GLOM|nr:10024_t:CDS:2 [Acaulospora colombiana]
MNLMMNDSIEKENITTYQYNMFDDVTPIGENIFKATLRNSRKFVILKQIHLDGESDLNDMISETSENLLVHNENIKLCTFKISKKAVESGKFVEKFLGSFQYSDSQHLRLCSNASDCKKSSDIFDLGIILWEIASGGSQSDSPFDPSSLSREELLNYIKNGDRSKVVAGTPRGYLKIYTDCLQYEESLRPNISQVFRDLKKINISDTISELEILIPHFNDTKNKNLIKADILNVEDNEFEPQQKPSTKSAKSTVRSTAETDAFIKSLFQFFTNLFFKQHIVMAPVLIKKYIKDHKKNPVKVFHQLLQSQYRSYITSMIGCFYQYGIGVVVDYKMAFEYYSLAVNDTIDSENEISTWSKSFKRYNIINSRILIASLYIDGKGINQNRRKAFQILLKTAAEGSSRAVNYIGYCFEKGYGVDQDSHKAFVLYSKAAEQGYLVAQCNRGYGFQDGVGTEKDEIKGFQYYLKAAMEGNVVAKYCVGWCFENGQGVEKNEEIAYYWYLKCANEGYSSSQSNVAYCYWIGQGVAQNEKKAFEWYRKAGENGNVFSQRMTGIRYMNGTGITKDIIKAIFWLQKAAENGDNDAVDELEDITGFMFLLL